MCESTYPPLARGWFTADYLLSLRKIHLLEIQFTIYNLKYTWFSRSCTWLFADLGFVICYWRWCFHSLLRFQAVNWLQCQGMRIKSLGCEAGTPGRMTGYVVGLENEFVYYSFLHYLGKQACVQNKTVSLFECISQEAAAWQSVLQFLSEGWQWLCSQRPWEWFVRVAELHSLCLWCTLPCLCHLIRAATSSLGSPVFTVTNAGACSKTTQQSSATF